MGLFDNLGGALSGLVGAAVQGEGAQLLSGALAKTGMGDMSGLVQQLQQGGLGQQVQSWASGSSTAPISPEQIQSALGDEHVQKIAEHFGLPVDAAMKLLAQHVPTAVAQAAPSDGAADSDQSS